MTNSGLAGALRGGEPRSRGGGRPIESLLAKRTIPQPKARTCSRAMQAEVGLQTGGGFPLQTSYGGLSPFGRILPPKTAPKSLFFRLLLHKNFDFLYLSSQQSSTV